MREYATATAFRAAVEAKLRERARRVGAAAYILRRQAALERLIVRLAKVAPDRWAVKGGLALETRFGERARVSIDLDLDHQDGIEAARDDLQRAAAEDVGDHFEFALVGTEELSDAGTALALRFKIDSRLAGRPFEPLQIDVTIAPAVPWDAQPGRRTGLLADLGLEPIDVLLVPLARHVAEKLHAYTRTYKGGGTTRARDLVDLVLIRELGALAAGDLADAIEGVFVRRATHLTPDSIPTPPRELAVAYRREASAVGLSGEIGEAHEAVARWLNPVLSALGTRSGKL